VGSIPVIAAIPVALARITATAALATRGWMRPRGGMFEATFVFIASSTGMCLQ
jgi:hypothetical protein